MTDWRTLNDQALIAALIAARESEHDAQVIATLRSTPSVQRILDRRLPNHQPAVTHRPPTSGGVIPCLPDGPINLETP
jgi:hypothetical protein